MRARRPTPCDRAAPDLDLGLAVVALFVGLTGLAAGCGGPKGPSSTPAGESFASYTSESWVRQYDPRKASNGYNLAFYKHRLPMLFDMNGRVVHTWPEARVRSRLRLLPDGSLLTFSLGRDVVEYDWDGNLVWQYDVRGRLPHHDVVRLANGNTLLVVLDRGEGTDELLEVNREGEVVWEWDSDDHLTTFFPKKKRATTHINSMQELPANPYFDDGDERFRPGNLLISARNLSTIFIIDRQTGELTWSYQGDLDYQHEAYMIPPGQPEHGRILVYNNRYHDRSVFPQTEVIEIDPASSEVTWRFTEEGFYSSTSGVEQPLPNGNVLISSSRGGRVFEVSRKGEIVWSWSPPFHPNRPQRVPDDHTPQLAALARAKPRAVRPAADYRHIDNTLYRFGDRKDRVALRIEGRRRNVLVEKDLCQQVILPEAPEVDLGYGVNGRGARRAGLRRFRARFSLWLRSEDQPDRVQVFEDTVNLKGDTWRHKVVSLAEYAYSKVTLCVDIKELGRPREGQRALAFWSPPHVRSAARPADLGWPEPITLSAEELEVRKEHLEALGYVD